MRLVFNGINRHTFGINIVHITFGSYEFLMDIFPNLSLKQFVQINKIMKEFIVKVLNLRKEKMLLLSLRDRVDIYEDKIERYRQ